MPRQSLVLLFGLLLGGCGNGGDQSGAAGAVGDTGTSLGGAAVVRSAVLDTSGAISGRFVAAADPSTVLRGNCPPTMWANFGIQFNHPDYAWIAVTLMSKDPIQPGQTGSIPLDWIDVSFLDREVHSWFFKGKGALEIGRHDSRPGQRRMTAVLSGNGLSGSQDAEGKTLDARFEFDLNFSCGTG